jgi:hypothetical protein
LELLQGGFTIRLWVKLIKALQDLRDHINPHKVDESNKIEVVASGVALEDQNALDTQDIRLGRDGVSRCPEISI